MIKRIKYFFTATLILVAATRCTDDFESINTNPNAPVDAPGELLMADIQRNAMNIIYNIQIGGEMGATWVQHWSWVQYNDAERYSPRQTSIEGLWDVMYEDVLADAKSMENLALEDENQALQGAAKVLQAWGFQVLTDMYGDIPFTDALKAGEGNFTPAYDPQETVYSGILALLEDANTLLATGEGTIDEDFDLVYGGDIESWQKFANSLKFRVLMRISNKTNVSADLQALMGRPMFTSNSDEAKMTFLSTQPNANPIYETIVFGNRFETKVSDVMINTLQSLSDPRLSVYAKTNSAGIYRGKPVGYEDVPNPATWDYNNVSGIGDFYLKPELPGYFMSFSELEFLKAEAAHRSLITGDAATFYSNGITANMNFNGITNVAGYLAANAYTTGNGLQQIGTQKWIALYGQGLEAWTEWRRTKIPSLQPAAEPIPSTNEIPSRFPYPATEQTTNSASYSAAIARQGDDLLWTKLWFMN